MLTSSFFTTKAPQIARFEVLFFRLVLFFWSLIPLDVPHDIFKASRTL